MEFTSTVPETVTALVKFPSRASCAATPGSAHGWPASRVMPAPPNNSSSGFASSGEMALKPTRKPRSLWRPSGGPALRLAERKPISSSGVAQEPPRTDPVRARCRTLGVGLGASGIVRLPVEDPFSRRCRACRRSPTGSPRIGRRSRFGWRRCRTGSPIGMGRVYARCPKNMVL